MIIVSGLARSGTSLMMNMLEAGGITPYTDSVRKADNHNVKGYREVQGIGEKLEADNNFLEDKMGCCKVLSPFLRHLGGDPRIIYMERDLGEVVASMGKMSGSLVTPEQKAALGRHVAGMKEYLTNRDTLYVSYNKLVTDPSVEAKRIKAFVPEIDMLKALQVIDKDQYRNRK